MDVANSGYSLAPRVAGILLVAALIGFVPGGAKAGDVTAGASRARTCEACHGLDGLAKIVEAPNLAGQNEQYLVKQLLAFKAGERHNEMMSVVVPTLSDKDIDDVAAYYSAIEIHVGKIPGP
jgi:cytochrome c553